MQSLLAFSHLYSLLSLRSCGIILMIETKMGRDEPKQINMQCCTVANPRNQSNVHLLIFVTSRVYTRPPLSISIYLNKADTLEKCRLNDIKINFNFLFFELLFSPLPFPISLFGFGFCALLFRLFSQYESTERAQCTHLLY